MAETAYTSPSGPAVPVIEEDPFSPQVLERPGPFEERLRDTAPLVYLSAHGVYAAARYLEVREALRDWQSFGSGAGVGLSNFRRERPWRAKSLLLEADPPWHDAPRRVLADLLGPRTQDELRVGWAAEAERLVDGLQAAMPGRSVVFDAVRYLAEAFPMRVMPDALGIPESGRENLLPFSDFLLNAFGPRNALVSGRSHNARELSRWVDAGSARESLAQGGLGARIWAAADRGDITYEQAPLVVRSLYAAGVNSTVHALAGMLYALADNPEQWQRLRENPGLAGVAFDEAVRWGSPVQTFFRTTGPNARLGGVPLPDGEKILLFLGSANRDPRRWETPESYSLSRDPSGHLGFGYGLHQCVGQNLARLEAVSLIDALVSRVARWEPAGPPRFRPNNTLRCWASVPVRVWWS
ncbi:cytochrome P450 [Nocardiopsis alba]|uniref:cytochrome P450 n=1 Tax=Nocardiopsis alba TaxID=53437 RepID=UPI00366C7967